MTCTRQILIWKLVHIRSVFPLLKIQQYAFLLVLKLTFYIFRPPHWFRNDVFWFIAKRSKWRNNFCRHIALKNPSTFLRLNWWPKNARNHCASFRASRSTGIISTADNYERTIQHGGLRDHDLVGVACRDFGKMSMLVWQKNAVFVNFQVPQRQIILCQKVKAMFIAPVRCAKIVQFTRWSHGVICKSESVYQYWYYSCQIYQPLPQWNTYIGIFMCQMLSKIGVSLVSYWYMCSVIPIIYQYWYLSCRTYQPLSNEIPILIYVSIKCCLKLEYHWYFIGKFVQEFQ